MLSFKKKIYYTIFTTPFVILTFKAYKWQTRRKGEKILEIQTREERLKSKPDKLTNSVLKDFEMNQDWEFRPVQLIGHFDSNKLLINKTREGEPGYHIVSPFYCYQDEAGLDRALLVDRGWIPYDYAINKIEKIDKIAKQQIVRGIMYRGDTLNKYSKVSGDCSEAAKNKLFYMNPAELALGLKLENPIASQFLIKTIDFNSERKYTQMYPMIMKTEDLMVWTISPEKHQDYANFWIYATGINILSNIFVWVFL